MELGVTNALILFNFFIKAFLLMVLLHPRQCNFSSAISGLGVVVFTGRTDRKRERIFSL
jgi:hypothetical protein